MDANIHSGAHVKARLHQVLLWGVALAHSSSLLRLAFLDSRVIIRFSRAEHSRRNSRRAHSGLQTILSPLLQCTRLFGAIPPAAALLQMDPKPDAAKLLAQTFKAVSSAAMLPNRVLTTPLGRRCQALTLQRCFLRFFKIHTSFPEADSLAYQSSTASIILGCIRSSGYPSLLPSHADMRAAIRAQIRLAPSAERRVRGRELIMSSLLEQVRLFRTLWPRIKARMLRSYWGWIDMTERRSERKNLLLTRNALLRHVLHASEVSARHQQGSLRMMLALEIHNQAVKAICKLNHDLGGLSETSFKDSVYALFDNFRQCTNLNAKPPTP